MKFSDAVEYLRDGGVDNPKYDAAEIFTRIGGFERSELLFNPSAESHEVLSAIQRRKNREPLQYIIGNVGFFRESYKVTPDCLIPRSDTEILVEYAVSHIPEGECFADLCTGSGCIAISTLKNTKDTKAVAADISDAALTLARENAEENGVSDRLSLIRCDCLSESIDGEFFAVLSNPPYVTRESYNTLEPEIYFEPENAFVANDDGLEFYKKITVSYKDRIRSEGFIAFEIGFDQAEKIKKIAEENMLQCELIKDYSDNFRVAVFKK